MSANPRSLKKDEKYFAERDKVAPERLATVEGVKMLGQVDVRKLMVGDEILLLHVFRKSHLMLLALAYSKILAQVFPQTCACQFAEDLHFCGTTCAF